MTVGRTVMERKMILVNRQLNSFHMGRYQWSIWALCGFGYMVDLAFAKLFGLILSPMVTELGISAVDRGNLSSCFSAGLCVGAFGWGVLVDIIGRKWAFNLTLLITAFFGLFLGVPSNYGAICALALLCGIGLGGNIPTDATICLEFLPAKKRWLIVLLSGFQPLGVFLCSLISWALIPSRTCRLTLPSCRNVADGVECCRKADNMGWRYASYTIGGLCLFLFIARFLIFNFKETPKFLLLKGRDEEAIAVVHYIAKYNKLPEGSVTLNIDQFHEIEANYSQATSTSGDSTAPIIKTQPKKWYNLSHMKVLFSSKYVAYITLLIWVIYMVDYWSFSVAGTFLPTVLREKGAARSISTKETYRNYIIQALCGLPGVAIGALLTEIRVIGQKYSLAITGSLMGVCLCLYAVIDSQDANVAFNALEYCWQSAFNAILYGVAPLYFPTAVRGTGVGSASALGRMIGICAPLIGARILAGTNGLNDILYAAGAPMFGAALVALLLPNIRHGHVY